MLEVRIRRMSEGVSRHLCTWSPTDLDSVIPTLQRWGLAGEETTPMFGQFVLEDHAAYFEVVVEDEDDE